MNYKRKTCRHRFANGKFVYPDVWGFKKSFLKDYLDKRNFNKVIHRFGLTGLSDDVYLEHGKVDSKK
jgi:hypothetical protein